MRYVPIRFAKEGMTLAKPVYGANGELLLSEGAIVSGATLNRLRVMRYNGVYVEDEISSGIEAKALISDHLKTFRCKLSNKCTRTFLPAAAAWMKTGSRRSLRG